MTRLEFVEPRQQHVAPEVGRRRQLQHTTDRLATTSERLCPLVQASQCCPGMQQISLALGGQTQAAGGAHEQPHTQARFQALQGRTGHCGRHVEPARGRGKAAAVGGTDEQLQVVDTQHFQNPVERASLIAPFFRRVK